MRQHGRDRPVGVEEFLPYLKTFNEKKIKAKLSSVFYSRPHNTFMAGFSSGILMFFGSLFWLNSVLRKNILKLNLIDL
jgi:hypothetical protein